ncbi:hypothetical protein OK348_12580 [Flavobacterium sp. MXW15]|uniref:Lectin n=1 Tax=Xanthomonas chitinilytica TaxID=2989819 RepID=A0ABT3JWN0_9XANT|nr:lectin [Xanthomonas sp. H13-6]MCW4455622.1 hypothetical protein [Flavobacterium sp. MXW15]MCW4472892.1 lectin [Xanthomonas sp. H13-6]
MKAMTGLSMGLALALVACGRTPAPPPAAESAATGTERAGDEAPPTMPQEEAGNRALARLDGYGPLRFGDDVAQVRDAWQGELNGPDDAGAGCIHLSPATTRLPRELAFMVEGGRFVRYDIGTAVPAAPGGGRVGMPLQELQELYPDRAELLPHKYVEGGHNLRVAPAAAGEGVLNFEIGSDGRVSAWRAGLPPQVDYVEGCS